MALVLTEELSGVTTIWRTSSLRVTLWSIAIKSLVTLPIEAYLDSNSMIFPSITLKIVAPFLLRTSKSSIFSELPGRDHFRVKVSATPSVILSPMLLPLSKLDLVVNTIFWPC